MSERTFNYVRYLILQCCYCMIKINKLESAPCNDCGYIASNDGLWIDWSLYLQDLSSVQTIS